MFSCIVVAVADLVVSEEEELFHVVCDTLMSAFFKTILYNTLFILCIGLVGIFLVVVPVKSRGDGKIAILVVPRCSLFFQTCGSRPLFVLHWVCDAFF